MFDGLLRSDFASDAVRVLINLVGFSTAATLADEQTSDISLATPHVVFTDVAEEGSLFVDGEYLPGPYTIQATADSVTINQIPVSTIPGSSFVSDVDDLEYNELPPRDGSRGRERGRGRGQNRRELHRPGDVTAVRTAHRLADSLQEGSDVVLFTGFPMRVIAVGGSQFEFYSALVADEPTPEQRRGFLQLVRDESEKAKWNQWLNGFQPTPDLRSRMKKAISESNAIVQEAASRTAARSRLETFAYPLTLIGMMLGVIAFGHMLKWTGRNLVMDQTGQTTPETTRCAEVALLLMLGMSAIDLLWTIMAGQAGVMKEINPLAAGLIHTPTSLAFFKVTATAIGCGLLYAFRDRRRVQEATWWMCLVCVLVTFRWVMFDSMTAS